VLANTAVHQPAGAPAPALIRLARTRALRDVACRRTPLFVRGTSALSRPPLPAAVRDALAAPYRTAERRRDVAAFVADIPLEPRHGSAATLQEIAEGVRKLDDVPALLLWGPRDPVFSDRYLRDLLDRLPHAAVQRYEQASHLVLEDAPRAATDAWAWITRGDASTGDSEQPRASTRRPRARPADDVGAPGDEHAPDLWAGWEARADDPSPAVVELGGRTVSWRQFARRVRDLAAGLVAHGVAPGDRVALLVPPGADLTAAAHACWRAGASVVVADPGLGAAGLARALRGAHPAHVVGRLPGLALAAALGVPGTRIAAGAAATGVAPVGLAALARRGRALLERGGELPVPVGPDAEAAVLFTSGATGPAKGVVYRHRQARAQLAALRAVYGISSDDRLVAAFPPFALYGPALGIASAVPATLRPGALTAAALADAAAAVDATMVFASPAALRSVVGTADDVTPAQRDALARVRRVVSAGAPVPATLLHALRTVLPHALAHTPYGMTEALPVTDVALPEIDAAGPGNGVCVGRPLPGVDVAISPLSPDGRAGGALTRAPGVTGEISVAAAHVKDRYDQLWATERASTRDRGRHRTGDVGHLDDAGRLWVEGRLVHVVTTAAGPVTPVGVEQRAEAVDRVRAAAAVGVGPSGTQQVVVVVCPESHFPDATRRESGFPDTGRRPTTQPTRRPGAPLLAPDPLATAVRAAAGVPVAAVLVADALPVDIRHAAKVDRARVAAWAERVMAGQRAGQRP
jgi:acyl-CoA synthetase (AMP-forming)/AMP-acid ligase II